MARVILACETLKNELNMVMDKLGCEDPVIWLKAGDHNIPQKRREAIEAALRACSQYDTVLLAMSFCGGALTGLESGHQTLLLPCFDDCIGLLVDHRRPDAYYLTDGWLAGERNILAECRNSLDKYGAEKTNRIYSAMLRGYRSLIWVDCRNPEPPDHVKVFSGMLGLQTESESCDLSRLEDLLRERMCPHILRIPPQTVIRLNMRHGMIPVVVDGQEDPLYALPGENLLELLRRYRLAPQAPCGGQGNCGKCIVKINGISQRSCSVHVTEPICVKIPQKGSLNVLHPQAERTVPSGNAVAAVDIGTTSLVCSLLDGDSGKRIAVKTAPNPQQVWGADVVTRIRWTLEGHGEELTGLIRRSVSDLLLGCCRDACIEPESVRRLTIVGNPAMEQLFLGISPENLVEIPFKPLISEAKFLSCGSYLPILPRTELAVTPNISGYIGGDTVGCILAEQLENPQKLTLLVDIGTNGEMVLAGRNRLVACATAAGPALEGASIRFGMTASPGAIDHVWLEQGKICFSTIADAPAAGICGSGLIDAVAVFLDLGMLNARGRIKPGSERDGQRVLEISRDIFLTQEDIRHVQLAKGAIAAGIRLLTEHVGAAPEEIETCLLAGAFGTYIRSDSACRIGLLPAELRGKIRSVGNAAVRGAEIMSLNPARFQETEGLCRRTETLELASLPAFPRTFSASMYFP